VFAGSALILFITLFTNQYFHGGVWGTLHNKSVKPKIEIADAAIVHDQLRFTVYRVEGADVYGSFLIGITLKDQDGEVILSKNGSDLSRIDESSINNKYVAKVKPGKHSLVIPLGSKASLTVREQTLADLPRGSYQLTLTDISGITWSETIYIS
jgi:thiosulfate dehydrogenase [quinone] large subunit